MSVRADVLVRAAPLVVAAAVLAAAAASSIQRDLFDAGRPARWVVLSLLAAYAVALALVVRRDWRVRPLPVALVGAFCLLALTSAAWSADPRATLGRGTGLVVVVAAAVALAGSVRARPQLAEKLLDGVLLGVAGVAVVSLLYWAAAGSVAYQPATVEYPARFRGIELNPNALGILLAVGMPIALARTLDPARGPWARALHGGLLMTFAVEIVLTGSRGALLAGFLSLVAVAALVPAPAARRALLAGSALVALVVAAWASTVPQALPPSAAPPPRPALAEEGIDAEQVLPLEAEIGSPWWAGSRVSTRRAFFDTSVRLRALRGSVERAAERPLLGWGYGAEIEAFVNRYYGFNSQNPENGYVGLLLQLGFFGLLLFLVAVAASLFVGIGAALRRPGHLGAAAVGAVVAALLVAVTQSYFHGPGNVVFVAFWTALLLTSVLGLARTG